MSYITPTGCGATPSNPTDKVPPISCTIADSDAAGSSKPSTPKFVSVGRVTLYFAI